MLGVDLTAPDHTTRSRRGQHLALALRRARPGTSLHLIVDSTGLSIVGEGEWAAATHGGRGRRGWRKLHLGVDGSRVIVACALTEPTADDAMTGISLVDEVDGHLTRVTADPAYDTLACYGAAGARGARVVVPPTKTASLSRRGARSGARDRTIRRVKALGRRRWKKASGSHQHARVENAFVRYTSIVGDCLRSCVHGHSALCRASCRHVGPADAGRRAPLFEELSGANGRPMIGAMTSTVRPQQRYDHRLRDLVRRSGDVTLATDLGVPRSTARGWLRRAPEVVVSLDVTHLNEQELHQEILRLRRRVQKLAALLRLVLAVLRASGFTLSYERLPNGRDKMRILRAVDRARGCIPLRALLRILRLSPSRFHAWRRQDACALDDQSSCPRTSPHRVTPSEVRVIEQMVTAPAFRHVPTGTLAVLAQRLGKVWASPSTWYRLVRTYGWRRPRLRVHPAKPKVGLRTTRADEMWHIDTTVIRLLDGTRAYLHAVIFSRRILAWRVAETFAPVNSVAVLLDASRAAMPSETVPAIFLKNSPIVPSAWAPGAKVQAKKVTGQA